METHQESGGRGETEGGCERRQELAKEMENEWTVSREMGTGEKAVEGRSEGVTLGEWGEEGGRWERQEEGEKFCGADGNRVSEEGLGKGPSKEGGAGALGNDEREPSGGGGGLKGGNWGESESGRLSRRGETASGLGRGELLNGLDTLGRSWGLRLLVSTSSISIWYIPLSKAFLDEGVVPPHRG